MKRILIKIGVILLLTILFCIPFLNVFLLYAYSKHTRATLYNWTKYKQPLWRADDNNIKLTLSNWTSELLVIYEGTLKDFITNADGNEIILNTQIKYIEVEDNVLVIRLWNERKINKLLNIKNEY